MVILNRVCLALVVAISTGLARPARAAENVTVGVVGSASALIWLYYIAKDKSLFEKEGLAIDLVSVSSSADAIRQLTAGSLHFLIGGGLIDPIRAAAKGSSAAIARIEGQSPPYALMGKRGLTGLKDLKGKLVSVGGATDITRVYVERTVATVGLKPSDLDFVYAGASAPRFAALQAGAVDAAIVAPPYNFVGAAAGLPNLGNVADFVKDLPFAGDQVDTRWATANPGTAKRFLSAYGKAIDWFYDERNQQEAVDILVRNAKTTPDDAQQSYTFFKSIKYFEPTGKISRRQLEQLFAVLKQLGEEKLPSVDQVVVPGISVLTD
jgi:NitT/TauT family transport system substrate-binding protein